MKENKFQAQLIKKLEKIFPDGIVINNTGRYIQGFPDLLVLNDDKWAALECKRDKKASCRPNQQYYVDKLNDMSFAAMVYPENEEEILDAVQRALRPSG